MSKVIRKYDMLLASVLLTINLADLLSDQRILIRFAADLNQWRYPVYGHDLQRVTYEILIEGRQVVKESLPEEVRFIVDRYDDIVSSFPTGFDTEMLAPFAYWFLNKVKFDEFTAYGARGRLLMSVMAGLAWPAPV